MEIPKDKFTVFLKYFGHLFFVGMIIYAIVYAVERSTYSDSAWIFFNQLNSKTFSATIERWPAFIPEIPLFISAKFELPLQAQIYIFSVSYILMFYLVWLICVYKLKNSIAGLVIIFGMTMGVREVFINTVTEVHQCLVYGALLWAVLNYQFQHKHTRVIMCAISSLLVLWVHPFGLFIATSVLLIYFQQFRKIRESGLLTVASFIGLSVLIAIIFPPKIYGENSLTLVTSGLTETSGSKALEFLILHFPNFYWLPEVAGVILLGVMAARKQWVLIGMNALLLTLYISVVAITFRSGDSSISLERLFLPAFFVINLSLALQLTSFRKSTQWLSIVIVILLVSNGVRYINNGCLMYKKRLAYLDELISSAIVQNIDKAIIPERIIDHDRLMVPWALGSESLIYSNLVYHRSVALSVEQDPCDSSSVRISADVCLLNSIVDTTYFSVNNSRYTPLK